MTNKHLTNLIIEYRSDSLKDKEQLCKAFQEIVDNVFKYSRYEKGSQEEEVAKQDTLLICFEKIPQFDVRCGKAFNYFTTIAMAHMRQIYTTNRIGGGCFG